MNISWRCAAVLLVPLSLLLAVAASASPLVVERYDVDHLDLARYWALGALDTPVPTRYPYSMRQVLDILDQLEGRLPKGSYEEYLASIYRLELDEEATVEGGSRIYRLFHPYLKHFGPLGNQIFSKNLDLYKVRDSERDLDFGLNTVQRFETIYDETFRGDVFVLYGWGMESWITWKKHLGGYIRVTDTVERGAGIHETIYSPYAGFMNIAKGSHTSISYDETVAHLTYDSELFRVRAGRGKHAWGPGLFHRLVFEGMVQSYPYVEIEFDWAGKVLFSFFHGQMDAGDEVTDDTLYVSAEGHVRKEGKERYVSAHRLELMPTSWMAMGFTEAVIYGDRAMELGYMLPLNLYWSEGHNQNYDDNIMWSLDLRLRVMRGLLLYGELLIDEMNFGALFTSEFGNRTGYVAGSRWIEPLGIARTELEVEYTKLRPFVYTHWYDINLPTNYGEKLGSVLEPNSDELNLKVRWRPWNETTIDLYGSLRRHGSTPEGGEVVGGSYLESRLGNKGLYAFLDGVREDRSEFGTTLSWRMLEQMWMTITAASGESSGEEYIKVIGGIYYRY